MGRVRRDPKYIGSAILNDLETGDEVCVCLEDGTYRNREVTIVDDTIHPRHEDGNRREATIGDVESDVHVVLGAEAYDGEGMRCEWDVYAHQITEDPDNPTDSLADPEALYVMDQSMELPDMTFEEAAEQVEDKEEMLRAPAEIQEEMDTVISAAKGVKRAAEKVEQGDLTLAEFERRLDTLETKHGGRLPFQ
jgi:hypothetical protein